MYIEQRVCELSGLYSSRKSMHGMNPTNPVDRGQDYIQGHCCISGRCLQWTAALFGTCVDQSWSSLMTNPLDSLWFHGNRAPNDIIIKLCGEWSSSIYQYILTWKMRASINIISWQSCITDLVVLQICLLLLLLVSTYVFQFQYCHQSSLFTIVSYIQQLVSGVKTCILRTTLT